jgi:hypothetical protein
MVILRNVKLCTVSIVYLVPIVILYICLVQFVERGTNWFFYA